MHGTYTFCRFRTDGTQSLVKLHTKMYKKLSVQVRATYDADARALALERDQKRLVKIRDQQQAIAVVRQTFREQVQVHGPPNHTCSFRFNVADFEKIVAKLFRPEFSPSAVERLRNAAMDPPSHLRDGFLNLLAIVDKGFSRADPKSPWWCNILCANRAHCRSIA